MRSSVGPTALIAFALLIAWAVVSTIVASRNLDALHESNERVARTHVVLTRLGDVMSAVKDAETGQRGYLITSNPDYLKPYNEAVAVVHERLERLRELPADRALTAERSAELGRLIDKKFAELNKSIVLHDWLGAGPIGRAAARGVVQTDEGHQAMEAIRDLIDTIYQEEQAVLAREKEEAESSYSTGQTSMVLGTIPRFAVLGLAIYLIRRELVKRWRAEGDAHLQREWCMTTLTSIGDGVLVTDKDGRIKVLNHVARELTGWGDDAVGEPLGKVFVIVNEETRLPAENPVERVLRDGKVVGLANHTILKRRDGRELPIDDSAAPIIDPHGKITGVVLVFRDVTERRRSEAELLRHAAALQEADRRKDEFLAMLAHELRNPLAPIYNAVQIVQMEGRGGEHVEWAAGVIAQQARHLTRLVDDLLDVSRITQGKVQLQKDRVELAAVVKGALEACAPTIDERRHTVTMELPPRAVWFEADPTRLTQVVCNLLNNAAKYTNNGGHIAVKCGVEGGEVVVRVRDDGVGIAPEMLARVFDLFAQADKSLARTNGGLGIGLTLVRRLVELHGGRVEVHSAGPGKGSEFVVRLPLIEAAPPEPPRPPTPRGQKRRLLLVDDNAASVKSLGILLRAEGDHVELAYDGPSALDAARRTRPDVVLLDIGLPGADGYEVARQLRREPAMENVLLIAMSGYGQEEDRRRAQEAGFNAHLLKPVDLTALQELLARFPDTAADL
jgi:PAS domain S-box-containing protein